MKFNVKLESKCILSSEIIFDSGLIKTNHLNTHFSSLKSTSNHFLISDTNVFNLYGKQVLNEIKIHGPNTKEILLQPDEKSKSMNCYQDTLDSILVKGLDKESYIICLGGGVVSNLAGFLASTLYRGINFINIPTTTLAQVDASIDFKQAINLRHGKNLIGSFYPAEKIILDPSILKTLDHRNYVNGFSESIKHALVQDQTFYTDLMYFADSDFRDESACENIVKRSIELKLEVMKNYKEDSTLYKEMTKQYGHSIGHAIEHVSNGEIYHGEAIAIGMFTSAMISVMRGISSEDLLDVHANIFKKFNLPFKLPNSLCIDKVLQTMRYDKHYLKIPKMMLLKSIGVPYCYENSYDISVSFDELRTALLKAKEYLKK